LKDFAAEIRGGKDIKEFILSAIILLDVQDISIRDLIEIILRKIKQISLTHSNINVASAISPTSSISAAATTMMGSTSLSSTSGHRENLNIEEIKQELFVDDRGIESNSFDCKLKLAFFSFF